MANLDIVEREDLAGNARETGAYLKQRLTEAVGDHPMVCEVRGVGLLAAVEFAADKTKRVPLDPNLKVGPRVSAACLEQGVIARGMPNGDILGFAPPLTISRDEVDRAVEATRIAVSKVADQLVAEGVTLAG
jgi:L-2,4-diaminobutyrate transaminase